MNLRRILSQAALIIGTLVFAIGLQAYAQTYTAPAATPPNGNAQAPLDTGLATNYKTGQLFVNMDSSGNNGPFINGLVVGGRAVLPNPGSKVSIGTAYPMGTLDIENGASVNAKLCLNGQCESTLASPPGTLCGDFDVDRISGTTSEVNCEGVDLSSGNCPYGYSYKQLQNDSTDDAYSCVAN